MELNLFILQEDLADICVASYLHGYPSEFPCSHPLPYMRGMAFFATPVYVARAEDLPAEPPAGFVLNLICEGEPPTSYLRAPHNVLVLADGVSVITAHDRAMACFARYNTWQHELERASAPGIAPRRLGEVLAPVFDNPVNLWSSGYKCLFHITDVIDAEDNILKKGRLEELRRAYGLFRDGEYLDPDLLRHFVLNDRFEEAANRTTPSLYEGDDGGYRGRSLLMGVRKSGDLAGYFIVDEVNHLIGNRDVALAMAVRPYLQTLLAAETPALRGAGILDDLLGLLLAGTRIKRKQLAEMAAASGWGRYDEYVTYALRLGEAPQLTSGAHGLKSFASRCSQHTRTIVTNGWVAVIANKKREALTSGERIDAVMRDIAEHFGTVGESERFHDLAHLRSFFEQACAAVELSGDADGVPGVVTRYCDCYVADMLQRCRGNRSQDALVPESLRRLASADERDNSDLVRTLALYLEHNLSVTSTARAANIHRNTCLNRVRRIQEIVGLDLSDPDVVLMLRLSVKFLGY